MFLTTYVLSEREDTLEVEKNALFFRNDAKRSLDY